MTESDWPTLPPRLKPLLEAEYPQFSAAEMARRRAAVDAALAEADCGHLVFYGANRAGSAVQWLTQWPVTVEAIGVFTPGERDALFVQWINHAPLAKRLASEAEVSWGGESSVGAAIAAASNKRLMVMPPVVTATTESRLLCPPEDATVWLADVRAGGKIPKGALAKWFPPLYEIQGAKLAKMSAPKVPKSPSDESCRSGMNPDLIA